VLAEEEELDELEEVEFASLLKIPPIGAVGGTVLAVKLMGGLVARPMKAASVFPVVGALMAPTMPLWQWLPAVWPQ
jgi:hypothetical protein